MRGGAARLAPAIAVVGAVAAPAGCLLPWETVTVDAAGPGGVSHLDALHGTGVLACVGACVALVAHPDDDRYRDLFGSEVATPLFGVRVPVLAHHLADPGKGTGIAMICTFGGHHPGSGSGWSVAIAPGLPIAAAAGVALLAAQAVSVIAAAGSEEATLFR